MECHVTVTWLSWFQWHILKPFALKVIRDTPGSEPLCYATHGVGEGQAPLRFFNVEAEVPDKWKEKQE